MDVRTVINYPEDPTSPPLEYTENYDSSMLVEDGGNVLASHYFDLAAGLSVEMTPTLNFIDSNGTPQSVTGDVFRVAPYFFYQNLPNSTVEMQSSYPAVQTDAPYTFTVSAADIYQGSDKFLLYNLKVTAYNTSSGDYYEEDIALDIEYTPGEDITLSGTLPLSDEGEYTVTFEIYGSWNVEGFGNVMYSSAYTQHNVTVGSTYTVNLPSVEAADRYGLSVSQPMLSLTLDDSSFTAGPIETYAGGDVYVRYTLGGTPVPDPADPDYDPMHDTLFYANITVPHAEFGGITVAIQQISTYNSSYPAEFFTGSSEETRYMYFVFTMPSADIPAGAVKATEITITSSP